MTPERDVLDTGDAGPAALRGGALRSTGYAAGAVLSLISAPLLIRHLGQEDYGRYVTVLSVAVFFSGFTEAGLNAISLREYSSLRGAARDRLLANALGLRLTLSLAAIGVAMAFSAVAGYGAALVLGTFLVGITTLLTALQMQISVALFGNLRFGLATLTDLVRQALTVALLVALVFAGAGVVPFLAVGIPAGIVGVGMTVFFVRGQLPLRPAFVSSAWWPLIRDTLPYAIAIALNAAYFRVVIIVMSLTATELQTGYFSTSFRVIEVLIAIPALVIGAAFPILARAVRDDHERFANGTERIFELGILIGTTMAIALGLGAGFAIEVLGGDEAAPAADVLRIQGIAMIATFIAVGCSYALLSLHRTREIVVANAVALVAAIALTLALVPSLEAQGGAIAAVSAEVALAIASVMLLRRADASLRLPLGILPIAAVAAAAAVGTAVLVGGPDLVRAPIGVLVFLGVVTALGRFPPEVRHAIDARRRPR